MAKSWPSVNFLRQKFSKAFWFQNLNVILANKIKVFKKCPTMILFNGFKLLDDNDVCRPDFWGWMFDFKIFIIKDVKRQEIWLWWHLTTRLLTPVFVFQTPIARAIFCYWHFLKISIYLQKWLSIFNEFYSTGRKTL